MWDERYNTEEYIYGIKPNDFLSNNTKSLLKGNVLCLADGEGRNSVHLAKLGFDVTAVDLSANALKKAAKLAEENNVNINFIQADLANFNIQPNYWSSIVSIFCHTPADIRIDLHKKIVNGLKPKGILLLEAYTPDQLNYKTGGPPLEDMMMSLERLENELAGLNFNFVEEIAREVIEGTYHTGIGAVVQIIAEKP